MAKSPVQISSYLHTSGKLLFSVLSTLPRMLNNDNDVGISYTVFLSISEVIDLKCILNTMHGYFLSFPLSDSICYLVPQYMHDNNVGFISHVFKGSGKGRPNVSMYLLLTLVILASLSNNKVLNLSNDGRNTLIYST